jgi:formate dehydrogenase major subunit
MPDHPVANGKLCAKGNAALAVLNHPDRLQHPLKKVNGKLEPISWAEALDTLADKFQTVATMHSADCLGFLASAKCTNEENYLFQKLARLLGTNNVDHCARLCHSPTVFALARAFGNGAMTNPLADLALSDCVFIIGSNPAENHAPALHWIYAAKDNGAKIMVADPRLTTTAWLADEFIQLKPGSDLAFLCGMARVIITEGLMNRNFIEQRTGGYEAMRASVMEFTPQRVAALTGVAEERVVSAARNFAGAGAASIVYCMGITQHTGGSANVAACANLALLTGNVGRPGAGVFPLRGQNNVQGACDMGALPGVLPGYASVRDEFARARFSGVWGGKKLPAEPGLTVVEMMAAAADGRIKAMWIMGEDPLNSDPNANQVFNALSALDFLAVQDIFLTDTAKLADLVLPAAAWAEKSGSFTNTERRVQWCDPVTAPPAEARSDLWIIGEVGERMGLPAVSGDAAAVLAEINRCVAVYGGITRERAAAPQGLQWPCPAADHGGTPILHTQGFATPDGRGWFTPVAYKPPAETVGDDYPLVLTTGRLALHYNSGSMTRRTQSLIGRISKPQVELHPVDAEQQGVLNGETVNVITCRGRVSAEVRLTKTVEPGVVFLPFHFPGVNRLTNDALDSDAKIPEYKVAACRVEKGGPA